jgi:polyisoprenyl-phosphate glycosyltransferase
MPHISIVTSIYNEDAATLSELTLRLKNALTPITTDFEIIMVDDGSGNDAWANIVSLSQADRRIIGIRFIRNFGQHAAIAAGIDHAKGDWVVVMDSDLQDCPEVIHDLYRKANEGFDVVFVSPENRRESVLYRGVTRTFYGLFRLLAGHALNHRQGNFSIISRDVADAYRRVPDRDRFYAGTLGWLGFRQSIIFAPRGERFAGHGNYTARGLLRLARRSIVGYSTRLLFVAIAFGFAMALVSLVMAGYVVIGEFFTAAPPPGNWAGAILGVLVAVGVMNVTIGLLGLYIADLYERVNQRPIYIVRQYAGRTPGEPPQLTAIAGAGTSRQGAPGRPRAGPDVRARPN